MSEKLTVAELLARNGRESSSADTGRRRRRHRNLEQGGVSVAELTGSIPVVQTEDDVAKAAKPEDTAAKVTEKPAAPKQEPAPKQEFQQDQRSVSRTSERPEEKTGQLSNVESSPKKAAEAPKERKATEPTFGDVARGRIAEKPAEPTQSTQPAEPAKTTKATKVTKPIKPSKSAAAGTAAGTAAAGTAAAEVASGTDAKTPEKGGVTKRAKGSAKDSAKDTTKDKAKDSAKRKAVTAAAAPGVSSDERAQFAELERTLEDGEVVEYEDDTISWPMMILQAILAIAVGVGVFFGFSLVWAKAPTILALVLAIAVTLLLVGLVHALLRHRDKLLMILAAVVGLVLTIGPRLVQGL